MSELRTVWEEREELRHAVTVRGEQNGSFFITSEAATTDCGVLLPRHARASSDAVTCPTCLFGGLDGLLREFSESDVREGVAA